MSQNFGLATALQRPDVGHQLPDLFVAVDVGVLRHGSEAEAVLDDPEELRIAFGLRCRGGEVSRRRKGRLAECALAITGRAMALRARIVVRGPARLGGAAV